MQLGQIVPDFEASTNDGKIKFHDFIGNSWCILFSHPADFTPVCTTELARAAQLAPEFEKRNVKMIALSCNDVLTHLTWIEDIKAYGNLNKNSKLPYPIIDDQNRKLAIILNMIDPSEHDKTGLPLTCRAVFIIGPGKTLRLTLMYPASTGRNFDEILRVIDSLQLTSNFKVATPVDWKKGDRCMLDFKLTDEEALKLFPSGFEQVEVPSKMNYLRLTAQPDLMKNNNLNVIKYKDGGGGGGGLSTSSLNPSTVSLSIDDEENNNINYAYMNSTLKKTPLNLLNQYQHQNLHNINNFSPIAEDPIYFDKNSNKIKNPVLNKHDIFIDNQIESSISPLHQKQYIDPFKSYQQDVNNHKNNKKLIKNNDSARCLCSIV